jgi:pantoate--beta-alanine ligase
MKIIQTIDNLKVFLSEERRSEKTIGFVPTMGALHKGHLSLVEQCRPENDICVVSIFVNPTQFNDQNDLKTYPRTLEKDCEMLESLGCDYVFAPSEEEIYPEPDTRIFNLGPVAEVMEGKKRPGHFNGVAQIVSKLFDIIMPDNAYFGEKDFQQIAVIREMVKQLQLQVNIIACPIVREKDGLAMSSRNTRLTPGQREIAPAIARTLKESRTFAVTKSVIEVKDRVIKTLNHIPPLRVEYFEIIDGNTLQPIENWNETNDPVGCITVFCGDVRLIDNIKYEYKK